ncbi:proprotein convertase subtilisin/kexin type 5-like [Bolinopsis microptera]|uniref:proprotein convertase subtilisin/kexin type 5-like n=1 Tax=Bolinopsis microptera TaxID=2820187 RepID=UPI00307A8B3D
MYNGGTVSGNKFDETTAELICRIMGYDKVMSWNIANTYSPEPSALVISEASSCLSCPTNSTSLAGSTYCSCNDDTYISPDGDECLECPENSTSVKGSAHCTCVAGTYLYSNLGSCVPCSSGTVSKEGGTAPSDCVSCLAGSVPINNGKVCSCEKGYGWGWNSSGDGSCKVCTANFFKDRQQGTCRRCPHEATSLPLSEECHCPSGLSWDGESCVNCTSPGSSSGVCNCLAGTYWSEDSSQCEPCPTNHYSGQFFSVCSKCPIFTVSESQSSECSSCPKGYSWENHACTECPENHVGNGATCSICPEGTSPSKNKTICQKSADILSMVFIALSVIIITMVIGNIIFTWRERRARIMMEDIQMVYQAEPSTSQKKGGSCSEVAKPTLPERGHTLQQDDLYANFS